MGAAAVEIADFIGLELEAIDYPGLASLGLFVLVIVVLFFVFRLGFGQLFFGGVAEDHDHTRAVGRPGEVVDILRRAGEPLSFAAGAIEEPDLRFAFVASGEKSEVLAVGTPARVGGGDAFGGERDGVATVSGNRPDALFGLIFFQKQSFYGVGHGLCVRAELGVGDFADLEEVVDRDGAGLHGGLLSVGGVGENREEECCS